jgi:DNA-binding transcriptional LysR family regulator
MVSDVGAMLGACEAGAGIAQIMLLGSKHLIDQGRLVELFPEWSGELFPLYALYPSRQHRAAKVRAFIEFVVEALVNLRTGGSKNVRRRSARQPARGTLSSSIMRSRRL